MSFNWRDHLKVHPAADLFPLMSETDPAALKDLAEDIRRNGLQASIVLWAASRDKPDWLLVDGRNRLDALALLGLLAIDDGGQLCRITPDGKLSHIGFGHHPPCDPYAHAVSLNIRRRHLTSEQKRELIAKLLKAAPEKSNRQVAKVVGVSHPHIAKVRQDLEKAGDVETVTTSIDTKGRKQPAKKQTSRSGVATNSDTPKTSGQHENPLIVAWDKASEKQRRDLVWERKVEVLKAQQLIGRGAYYIESGNDDGLDIPDYLKRGAA
jgi:DNA-binding Lrp family transcriptional regulator